MHRLFQRSHAGFHASILAGILTTGCAPSNSAPEKTAGQTASQTTATSGSKEVAPENAKNTSKETAESNTGSTTNAAADSAAGANVAAADKPTSAKSDAKSNTKSTAAAEATKPVVQAEPASVRDAISMIDLRSLPRLREKNILDQSSTMYYYSAEGSVAAVDAMLRSELTARGWKEEPGITPATDQYVDRSYEQKGFRLRLGISTGSTAGEVAVNISNVGNVDVRTLPKTSDAEAIESSPVNATHRTAKSIPQIVAELEPKMKEMGWQVCEDFFANPIDVPHFKSIAFRKNGMKVNLGMARDPRNAAEKTNVFYNADIVLPFDIPATDSKIKLDTISAKAKHELAGGPDAVLAMVQKSTDSFGWKLLNAKEFEKGDSTTLVADTGRDERIVIGMEEEDGKNLVTYQRVVVPKKQDSNSSTDDNPQVAEANTDSSSVVQANTKVKDGIDAEMNNFQAEVNSTIQNELSKALGSLNSSANKSPAELADMQARALEMLKNVGVDNDADDEATAPTEATQNEDGPVPEDTEEIAPADRNIQKTIGTMKHGSKTFELKHAIAYVKMDDGSPVKVILLSGSPIKEEVAKQKLSKGLSLSTFDLVPDYSAPTLELQIDQYSVSMNAAMEGLSFSTNSSRVKSTVRYRDKKLQGRVTMTMPMEMQDKEFTIDVQVAQPVLQFEKVAPGAPVVLSQDAEYDFPFPVEVSNKSFERSPFRSTAEIRIQTSVNESIDFFTTQLEKTGWKKSDVPTPVNRLAYETGERTIRINLQPADDETQAKIVVRDAKAAKAEGMLPPSGKVLLVFGNAGEADVEITVAGKKHSLKAGQGAQNPKDALRVEVASGKHKVEWRLKSGGQTATEEIDVEKDSTWGLIYAEFGPLAVQLY